MLKLILKIKPKLSVNIAMVKEGRIDTKIWAPGIFCLNNFGTPYAPAIIKSSLIK